MQKNTKRLGTMGVFLTAVVIGMFFTNTNHSGGFTATAEPYKPAEWECGVPPGISPSDYMLAKMRYVQEEQNGTYTQEQNDQIACIGMMLSK